jgi:alkanesulfonate monooxygenase SsuD/methylene tetrahydromethanopterin reductase-like flavin-dependent oxidoreductase (luciferase family)
VFGTGEATGPVELDGFAVDAATKRDQWLEATEVAVRLMTEEPFSGHVGAYLSVPERNLVPKPLQKPHPPLWMAAPRLQSALLAAHKGMGALCFSLSVEPEDAQDIVTHYHAAIASDECVPLGCTVTSEVAMVLPMLVHEDEEVAIARGLESAQFYGWSLYYFLQRGATHPHGQSALWATFQAERNQGFDATVVRQPQLRASYGESPFGLRGAVGSVAQVRDLVRRYEQAGCDQLIFICQPGQTAHSHTCESLELFAREIMPEFAARDAAARARRADAFGDSIEQALARRSRVLAGHGQ